jgi:NAD(P)-dependent dehydrogenase (short-subunit alcohol dehydrogenase family)
MDLGLNGKRAIVTGASHGIGLAIVRALTDEGVEVIAGARHSSAELDALASGSHVHPVLVDLSTAAGSSDLVADALTRGPVDILVNNVGGVTPRLTGFLEVTDEQWIQTLTLDLLSAVRMTRAVLPAMLEAGRGDIVTTSSVNAILPDPTVIDYSAAKAALTNLCKSLSKEYGPRGIRVNTISPGPVATELWLGPDGVAATVARSGGGDPAAVANAAAAQSVTGRFTQPQEIADLVVFLAGERAANITGADFVIDGGLITTT